MARIVQNIWCIDKIGLYKYFFSNVLLQKQPMDYNALYRQYIADKETAKEARKRAEQSRKAIYKALGYPTAFEIQSKLADILYKDVASSEDLWRNHWGGIVSHEKAPFYKKCENADKIKYRIRDVKRA